MENRYVLVGFVFFVLLMEDFDFVFDELGDVYVDFEVEDEGLGYDGGEGDEEVVEVVVYVGYFDVLGEFFYFDWC